MEAVAKIEDLEARFRTLDEHEKERATALLSDASAILHSEFARLGREIDPDDEVQAMNLTRVCCSMVRRVMASRSDADLKSTMLTAGAYSEQLTFANPTGDMYITKNERRSLGLPLYKQRIGSILPKAYKGRDE